jgi:hypothetical protein
MKPSRKHQPQCPCLKCTRKALRAYFGNHQVYWAIAQNGQLLRPANSRGQRLEARPIFLPTACNHQD